MIYTDACAYSISLENQRRHALPYRSPRYEIGTSRFSFRRIIWRFTKYWGNNELTYDPYADDDSSHYFGP